MKLYYAPVVCTRFSPPPPLPLPSPRQPGASASIFSIAARIWTIGRSILTMLAISAVLLRLAIIDLGTIKRELGMSR